MSFLEVTAFLANGFVISLIIFSTKFKLHGEFMENVTKVVTENRAKREAAAAE